MTRETFLEKFFSLTSLEPSSMVIAQTNKLITQGYTYQEIYNTLWYLITKRNMRVESIETYGIGLIKDDTISESRAYVDALRQKLMRGKASLDKYEEPETIYVKRQERRRPIKEEEFDWNE